jgi:predicted CoA-binding protein
MPSTPPRVAAFLEGRRIAVAGVSRSGKTPANAIFQRLRDVGHDVFAVNPNAQEIAGERSYPDVRSVPGPVHGLMVVTHPDAAPAVVRDALDAGVKHVWFHRSFGTGSVSDAAVELCHRAGVEPIVGGCPMMYCGPVDPVHRAFRWLLRLRRRVPG